MQPVRIQGTKVTEEKRNRRVDRFLSRPQSRRTERQAHRRNRRKQGQIHQKHSEGQLQERLAVFMLKHLDIDGGISGHHVSSRNLDSIINFLKNFTFSVNGTQSIEKAFVTGGGVSLKEITPQTTES